jgi:PE-PPE domain/PE family
MTGLITQPQLMTVAAADVAEIGSAISAARSAAAGPTTSLVAAAQDEVSAITAALFGAYGQEHQALLRQAATFHDQFIAALRAAGNAYADTEAAAANALRTFEADAQAQLAGNAVSTATRTISVAAPTLPGDPVYTLVLGASGLPIPPPDYVAGIPPLYIDPFFGAGTNIGINTPEGLYPLTGIKDLTFDISVARGLTALNNAVQQYATLGGTANTINIFGYSQSAAIVSQEMQALNPTNTPGGSLLPPGVHLNVTLVGDVSNPNGGLLTRFPSLSLPSLGFTFGTATPDNSFPTHIYTIEYDGFADFPQYPIDFLSDLNAFIGIIELHGTYPFFSGDQILNAIQLTNTVGTPLTQYYILPTQNLPLLDPVRAIPLIGNPLADLLQPDMRVLVDLGYGSTTQGWSPDPPNVPTPFGVIPPVSAASVAGALAAGTQQGIGAFASDIRAEIASPPALSLPSPTAITGSVGTGGSGLLPTLTSTLSSPDSLIAALQSANSYFNNAVTTSVSAAYATLLPTADVGTALVLSVPSYDLNLFLDGVEQIVNGDPVGGLIYALGAPPAADTALFTLFGGFEVRVLQHAAQTIVGAWTSPATPSSGGVGAID